MNASLRNELFRSGPNVGENRTKNALLLTATSTTEAQQGDNNFAKALKRTLSAQRESEYINAKEFPRNDMSEFRRACEKVKQFMLGDNELKTIRDRLLENMRRGLDREGHKSAKGNFHSTYQRGPHSQLA